jgi:hypothetical protein
MPALVDPMCGDIEQAADVIIAGTTNRAVQQAALRWKIEGVPALKALFQSDPFRAVMDTWVPHETYLLSGNDHDFDINWGGFGTQIARAKPKHCLQQ